MDGQIVGIRTSTIDEKCQAFDTLVIYCTVLKGRIGPCITQSLERTLPVLQFYFHEGVQEAACSGMLTPYTVTGSLCKLIYCIQIETAHRLSRRSARPSRSRCVSGVHALMPEMTNGLVDGTKHRLSVCELDAISIRGMAKRKGLRGPENIQGPPAIANSILQRFSPTSAYPTPPPSGIRSSSSSLAFALAHPSEAKSQPRVYKPEESGPFFEDFLSRSAQLLDSKPEEVVVVEATGVLNCVL
ncbi:hypothetical protein JVT61DRAFT_12259 [Boletus reticuloceps]|uniref:Uncharacterized protein n=1 Tax=Boletus reticuloceps TaxID=495285 RepID=A0A8I3A3W5_9AGAM|nr:hypothetical protein JVT61DRAFT_12259 [Boletus reticuloceps]